MKLLLCMAVPLLVSSARPPWRMALEGLPIAPPRTTTVQDMESFTQYCRLAAPYFATLHPGDYEANRALVRRMVTYLAAVDALSLHPRMRTALLRAYLAMAALNFGQPGWVPSPGPLEPLPCQLVKPEPPFAVRAPAIEGRKPEDKVIARDLIERYQFAASKAATAWQSAYVLRCNLESQGMALNESTATSLSRIQLYLELAVTDLRAQDWPNARINIERAGYEAEKIFKTVGS